MNNTCRGLLLSAAWAFLFGCAPAAPELEGFWALVELSGDEVPPDISITLSITADEGISGQAACNRYMGNIERNGTRVFFGPLGSTRMACPDPQMIWEDRYLQALESVSQAARNGDSLVLSDAAGETQLRFSVVLP